MSDRPRGEINLQAISQKGLLDPTGEKPKEAREKCINKPKRNLNILNCVLVRRCPAGGASEAAWEEAGEASQRKKRAQRARGRSK